MGFPVANMIMLLWSIAIAIAIAIDAETAAVGTNR